MAKNLTLYIRDADRETWDKAKKYLAFYAGKSLSEYLTLHLELIVRNYEDQEGNQLSTSQLSQIIDPALSKRAASGGKGEA